MSEQARLVGWMLEQRGGDELVVGRFVLTQVTKGNKLGDEIRTVTVPANFEDEWAQQTAERLIDQAQREATTLSAGAQRYAVQAIFTVDGRLEEKSRARHLFTVAGPEMSDGDVSTISPDETGLVAASQQHAQFFAKLASTQTLAQIKSQQEEIDRLRRENNDLRRERLESFKVMEEVYSARADRDIERRGAESRARLVETSVEKVEMFLPMVLNHLAGKKVIPDSMAAILTAKSLVEKITPQQFEQLAGVLGPEQTALLLQLATTISRVKPEEVTPANGVTIVEKGAQ